VSAPGQWLDQARCVQADPELWFPERGGSVADAKRVCSRCPVRRECLDWAVRQPEALQGIWGGLTAHERRKPRRQLRRAA
jgi:WhiB family redox-sensing transcriptional regulator